MNKVSTRVTLSFNVLESPSLTLEQKELLQKRLATRLTKEGILHVHAQDYRSQLANKQAAIERFIAILHEGLKIQKRRRKRRISLAAHYERLQSKKHRSEIKKNRKKVSY